MASISVLTLNMNTGHGPAGQFHDRIRKKPLLDNLRRIANTMRQSGAEVVCLQEVDFDWKGTKRINQAKCLQELSGFPYFYHHPHHQSLLPWFIRPFWTNVVFNRDCGTAIFSKHPIVHATHHNFGQDLTTDPKLNYLARLLNESKGYTSIEIDIGTSGRRLIEIVNVHLLSDIVYHVMSYLGGKVRGETFARTWQTQKLIDALKEKRSNRDLPIVVAGDFNSVPREISNLHFPECSLGDPDDYRRDMTMHLIRESKLLKTIPTLFGSGTSEQIKRFNTYPAVSPDRTLDYIFATHEFNFAESCYHVLSDMISDHLAVIAHLEL